MSAEAEKRQKGCSSTEPEIVVDHDGPDRVDFGTIGGVTTGKGKVRFSDSAFGRREQTLLFVRSHHHQHNTTSLSNNSHILYSFKSLGF